MENSDLAISIVRDKDADFEWQRRRHPDWDDNYTLSRNQVITNRLTQRQSVNIPLTKTALRTTLANVDDEPDIYFDNLDNEKDQEIYYNEHWVDCASYNKLVIKDIVDKKNVFTYGRSFKSLNILNGRTDIRIDDPFDVLVDRYTDPANIDTAMQVTLLHIFRPLEQLKNNSDYDMSEIAKIEAYFASDDGLQKNSENIRSMQEKNQRARQMGATDVDNPVLGQVYVEINKNFKKLWDSDKKKYVIWYIVTCDQALTHDGEETIAILLKQRLTEVIGDTGDHYWEDHYPIDWWADDVEGTDIWSDSLADTLRTPNKVINAWFSQLVENRTLRNLGMMYYNSMSEGEGANGFNPQSWEPVAFGFYPVPGNPNEILKPAVIPSLSDTIADIEFIIQLAEKATAATSIQQGSSGPTKITLGEVQILQHNIQERTKLISKFYNESWRAFGEKYAKFIEAAADKLDEVEVFKQGYNGTMFSKKINPSKLATPKGYRVRVVQKASRLKSAIDHLQTLSAAKASMPGNTPLNDIYNQRLLDLAELNPEEQRRVLEFEKQLREQQKALASSMLLSGQNGQPTNNGMGNNPAPQPPAAVGM